MPRHRYHQLHIWRKPNGDIWVCLDTENLNKAIICECHKLDSAGNFLELARAVIFTELDALEALQTHLTPRDSLLTTFNIHWKIQVQANALQNENELDVFQVKMNIVVMWKQDELTLAWVPLLKYSSERCTSGLVAGSCSNEAHA